MAKTNLQEIGRDNVPEEGVRGEDQLRGQTPHGRLATQDTHNTHIRHTQYMQDEMAKSVERLLSFLMDSNPSVKRWLN